MPHPAYKRTKSVAERDLNKLMDKLGDIEYPPIYIKKSKAIFRFLDQGNTGTLSLEGRKSFADKLQQFAGISDERVAEMKEFLTKWHLEVAKHPDVKLTFPQFQKLQYVMMTDQEIQVDFAAFLHELYSKVFEFLDTNGDGIISRKEWRIFYKCLGIQDEKIADASFDNIDLDKNNEMSLDEFTTGIVGFGSTIESGKYDSFFGPLED